MAAGQMRQLILDFYLLYETLWYENFKWDKEKMKQKLKTDTVDNTSFPIIVDDTK